MTSTLLGLLLLAQASYARPELLVSTDWLEAHLDDDKVRIVDTRSEAEHTGRDRRGNPRGGAIPSAIHVDWQETLSDDEQTLKPASELQALLKGRGFRKTTRS